MHERLDPQDLARHAVGVEAIDGVIAGRDRPGRSRAAARAVACPAGLVWAAAARLNPNRTGRRLVVVALGRHARAAIEAGSVQKPRHRRPPESGTASRATRCRRRLRPPCRRKSTISGPEQGPDLGLRGVEEDRRLAVGLIPGRSSPSPSLPA